MLSAQISKYIEDSKINGKLVKWGKPIVGVYITKLTTDKNAAFWYSKAEQAIASWNRILLTNSITVQFQRCPAAADADIIVHWVKVGRVYEGMCKYLSIVNGVFKKVSIEIGMPNILSGKNINELSIYCAIMHEFGHALGLGHGVDIDDIMYVPHKKNISIPSENDIYVLKQIYYS